LKKAFLLGRGISKSLSPCIQNAAFRKLGINATYELEDLKRRSLAGLILSLTESDTIGFNVTSPFKEEIMKYLSEIDSRSKNIGAVNTVKISNNQKGVMVGYNTDYDGILASLRKLGCYRRSSTQKNGVILGAGGASRASIYVLLNNGHSNLTILNRTVSKAQFLSKKFESLFPKSDIEAAPLTERNFAKSIENCGLIINTISKSSSKFYPLKKLDFSRIACDTAVFDLGYKEESLFLKTARKNGLKTIDGLLMLVTQAAKSFEIWTGRKAPFDLMMATAKSAL
jgi:shikimate dehydrogenase